MMKRYIAITLLVLSAASIFAQSYRVGDLYTAPDNSKGIVFYVHPDGSGGWVVALNDVSAGCTWGIYEDIPTLVNHTVTYITEYANDTAGYMNTQAIRAYQQNNTYAAGQVDFNHGWYLPSPGQCMKLFAQLPFIATNIINAGGTTLANDRYWCSSERDEYYARALNAGIDNGSAGSIVTMTKISTCRVRAVRSFTYADEHTEQTVSYTWSTGDTTQNILVSPTQTTTYTVIVSTEDGCGDTVAHTIVVNSPVASTISDTACESYTWNGTTYHESGSYTQTFIAANGCDSVVTLHLTINTTIEAVISASADVICEGDVVTLQVVTEGTPSTNQVPPIAVGDILCTDGTTVKPADYASSGKTALGIVFYVDNTGEHGWAVHLHYQHIGIEWTTPMSVFTDIPNLTNYYTSRTAINDFNGYNNTLIIRNAGNSVNYPAAFAVDFDNGWYIPAAGQLRQLFNEVVEVRASLQIVGGDVLSLDSSHWSSTEYGYGNVWDVRGKGTVFRNSKHSIIRLRSIRSF